jgi:TPR repeat protein
VFAVGRRFEDGDGVQKNPIKAVEWFTRAAKMGDAKAIAALGWCYDIGIGVEMNGEKAVELYMRAAEDGRQQGDEQLGFVLLPG